MLKPLVISEICYMIQRLNSYNLRLTKWLKKSLEKPTGQMKKVRKVPESCKLTFHKGKYLKPSNINLASEFTDSTHTIYCPKNMAKKAANRLKSYFFIC